MGNTGLRPVTAAMTHGALADSCHQRCDFRGDRLTMTHKAISTTTPRSNPNTAPRARSAGRRPTAWNNLLTSQVNSDPTKTAPMNTSTNAAA